MMKWKWLLACLLAAQILCAQTVDPKLGMALQHSLDSMHQTLQIKGLSAALQLSDNAVWAGGSGVSTLNPIDQISPNHVLATGSSTKTVIAACVLQLADEGILSLDDSLHLWLPNFQYINSNITIRQLLRHQSGIRDIFQNPAFQPTLLQNVNKIWTTAEVINTFIQAPAFQPGTSWGYSNTNYLLLGMIIEAATGKPYYEEIKARFFIPLGLNSIVNLAYDPTPDTTAHLWLDITGDGLLDDAHLFFTGWKSLFSAIGAAGGYFAKPSDMAVWMRACMNGNMYTASTWTQATQTVSTGLPGSTRYGLGVMERKYLGLKSYGHGGDISYSTSVVYFPEKDISIAVQANDASINSWQLAATVQALLKTYLDCEAILSAAAVAELPEFSLNVSPNPFIENITVVFATPTATIDQIQLTLTDPTGRTVWAAAPQKIAAASKQTWMLDQLTGLAPGLYFLNAVWGGQVAKTVKILKQTD